MLAESEIWKSLCLKHCSVVILCNTYAIGLILHIFVYFFSLHIASTLINTSLLFIHFMYTLKDSIKTRKRKGYFSQVNHSQPLKISCVSSIRSLMHTHNNLQVHHHTVFPTLQEVILSFSVLKGWCPIYTQVLSVLPYISKCLVVDLWGMNQTECLQSPSKITAYARSSWWEILYAHEFSSEVVCFLYNSHFGKMWLKLHHVMINN